MLAVLLINGEIQNVRDVAVGEQACKSAVQSDVSARKQRKYLTPSEVRYVWKGEQYEILVSSGTITNTEFENFWDHFPNDEDR